ncbi:MAG: hypothetical protein P4L59_10285 [Desulfosporosinus sp.]|nr:hypothetical protein [Desulfosporosinus sp.]
MMTILPILLFLIVMAIASINKKNRITRLSWRGNLILSGVYLGILLMAVPTLYLLPKDGFNKFVDYSSQTEALSENIILDLYNNHLPPGGNLDNQPGLYKNSSRTFNIETKKLAFKVASNSWNYPIFVARKNADDGKIEVSTYCATQLEGAIDFTKLILPPIIIYQNGTLSLKSTHQSLNFMQCNADFTVNQFKNPTMGYGNGLSTNFGEAMVYIRVPKSLEIGDAENNGMSFVHMISSN